MTQLRAFRAHRYVSEDADITPLAAPPYDVIGEPERATLLARDPRNAVALELPEGALDPDAPGNRYENGAATWARWVAEGVVRQDPDPAVYVIEQRYSMGGRPVRRRAFVGAVGLEPFDAQIILPHERTLPKALADRLELLRATGVNTSQVFGLFSDPHERTSALFDAATAGDPIARAFDDGGVESVLWAVTEPGWIEELAAFMAPERIFIADGHHRYTVALAYRDERRAAAPIARGAGQPGYDSVMMALVNMDDPDLTVLPYNRVADAEGEFDAGVFYEGLSRHFAVEDVPPGHPSAALDGVTGPAFLVKTRADDRVRLARMRAEVDPAEQIAAPHSDAWKLLDVAILQELVLAPLLGIHPDRPKSLERLSFTKDAHEALAMTSDHDVAFILRPTGTDQMRAVAIAGETMPQKSTYFYPKLLSGLLYRSLD